MQFSIDPFAIAFEAFAALYPGLTFTCEWAEELHDEEGVETYGQTFFPDDGGIPEIAVSGELTVKNAVEVLVHELAHVAVGIDAEHGPAWEEAFDAIHEKYIEILEEMDAGA